MTPGPSPDLQPEAAAVLATLVAFPGAKVVRFDRRIKALIAAMVRRRPSA